ncbi:sensor histidine kinase [Luteimonas sp. R10]|uniref:sensor histidine kinase n=1 Tax=Luteimonas sp. R10 TaxID=3108176 RepID=UPI00308723CD|nr:histidine kinase [Luteimonas sp. R10]
MPVSVLDAARPARPDTLDRSVLVLTVCVWTAHFVLLTSLSYLTSGPVDDPGRPIARAIVSGSGVTLCLGMYALLRRWGGNQPWGVLLKAIALSTMSAALLVVINSYAFRWLTPHYQINPDDWMDTYTLGWAYIGHLWMLTTWSALYVGATVILEMRRRDVQLAAARDTAQQAQLLALRLQINPHFLFNTLNTLAGLVVLDRKEESERIVLNLSRFLRHTLTRTPSQFVVLADEIDMLRIYLDIEIARFRDRLDVRYEIEPGCERALVPSLILLPLAENSVKYALSDSEDGITIRIGARCEDGTLLLWLEDDGAPAPANGGKGLGIGLSNIRQQLAALFGDAAQFHAGPTAHGWRNLVRIPRQEASG